MPPVLVLQHYKENLRKCSLTPLRGRAGFEFRRVHPEHPGDRLRVPGGVVLALDAPPLRREDADALREIPGGALIIIDGNWAKISFLLNNLRLADPGAPVGERLLFRSLPDAIRTAYPRRSKLRDDPEGGLASIEALVAAFQLLGVPALDLLEGYLWRDEFLELNREFFGEP